MDENKLQYQVEQFYTRDERNPFVEWTRRLKNIQARIAIERRVSRLADENFGDYKFCRDGVWELRISLGPGYRVYYALSGTKVILLLFGGDKG